MQKVSFNPEGVEELLNQIYALPDPQLQQEAASSAADFRLWLDNNFILSPTQKTYIQEIDNQFIAVAGADVQSFMLSRLPIILVKEENPLRLSLDEPDDRGKLIDLSKGEKSRYSSESGFSGEQTLTFTISYEKS